MNDEQLIRYERRVHDTGYHMGFHDGYKTVLPILSDLIAELRASHTRAGCPDECGWLYDNCECGEEWDTGLDQCHRLEPIDRAEARLREVTDDDPR